MFWTDGVSGALCSGTVVAPRVIVSAKHCYIDTGPVGWNAASGPRGQGGTVGVIDVLMPPGPELLNEDIAVVILGGDIGVDPVAFRRDMNGIRPGDGVRLVGYGENSEDGETGRKYSGTADILGFGPIDEAGVGDQEILFEGAAACGGDSGGTVLDGNGALMGVIVRGADVACPESTFTVATRVDGFLGLIDQGIQEAEGCVASGEEICNWADDDCDGAIDEVCASFTQECSDRPCQPGHVCVPLGGTGPLTCTVVCDPSRPAESCFPNTYCLAWGCGIEGGHCVLTTGGLAGALGDACSKDEDCATLYCRDPADGGGARCMVRCEDNAVCGAGSVCAPVAGGCGACVPEGGAGLRSFGQPCDGDAQCASGQCGADVNGTFCTQACGDCPDLYYCARGECARGEAPDDQGRPCLDNPDCFSGLCAHWPEGSSCTTICSDLDPCPEGLSCTDTGEGSFACKPDRSIVGQPCSTNEECLSSLCGDFTGGEAGKLCTEPCAPDGTCPADLACIDTGGLTLCAPAELIPQQSTYGCGCTVPGQRPSSAALLALLIGPFVVTRRRRRPS